MTASSSPQNPHFKSYKLFANLYVACRTMIKTLEFTYSWGIYNEKQKFAQEANFIDIHKGNITFFGTIYNTVTSLNAIRTLSLVKNAGDYYYSEDFSISTVSLHAAGIALDYLKPEEYCGYKTGTAIHYLPELIGISLTAAFSQGRGFATTGKLNPEHLTTILKNVIPSVGITIAFLGNKYAQQYYNELVSEEPSRDVENHTIVVGDSGIHYEL